MIRRACVDDAADSDHSQATPIAASFRAETDHGAADHEGKMRRPGLSADNIVNNGILHV